eukprot:1344027-Pleurochrysis_carterae.AAC.1
MHVCRFVKLCRTFVKLCRTGSVAGASPRRANIAPKSRWCRVCNTLKTASEPARCTPQAEARATVHRPSRHAARFTIAVHSLRCISGSRPGAL